MSELRTLLTALILVLTVAASASALSLLDGTVTANRQDSCTGGSQWFGESLTTLTIDAQNTGGKYVEVSGKITGISALDASWVEIGLIPKDRWDYWQTAFSGNWKAAVFDKGLYVVHWSSAGDLGLQLKEGWDDWTSTTYHNSTGPYGWELPTPSQADPWEFTFTMHPTTGNDGDAYLTLAGETVYGSQPFGYGVDAGNPVSNDNDYSECYLIAQIWSTTANATFSFTDVKAELVPEPLTVATLFLAVGGLGMYYRRRRKMG